MLPELLNELDVQQEERLSVSRSALYLDALNQDHISQAAKIMRAGGIVAFPFNGIYGLFGDIDNNEATELIIKAKNRPKDKKLVAVSAPEYLNEIADLSKLVYPKQKLIELLKGVHALGVILHASTRSPYHLVDREQGTILSIWTEYLPLREVIENLRSLGGRALIGTSANKSGQPTHFDRNLVWEEFKNDVDAVVSADFNHLSLERKKSTTVVDLTNHCPRLHRLGNVSEEELTLALERYGFPPLIYSRDVILVRPRR